MQRFNHNFSTLLLTVSSDLKHVFLYLHVWGLCLMTSVFGNKKCRPLPTCSLSLPPFLYFQRGYIGGPFCPLKGTFFPKYFHYFQYLVNVNFFISNTLCTTPTTLLFCMFVIKISVDAAHGYSPRAIDMSNVTLSRDVHVSQK